MQFDLLCFVCFREHFESFLGTISASLGSGFDDEVSGP